MLYSAKAHALLVRTVKVLVKDILDVAQKLATEMCGPVGAPNATRLTGQLWADCEALETIDLNQTLRDSVSAAVRLQGRAIQDALDELNEELEKHEKEGERGSKGEKGEKDKTEDAKAGSDDDEDLGSDFDDDIEDFFDDFDFQASDMRIVPGCILLLKSLASFNKLLLNDLSSLDDSTTKDLSNTLLTIHSIHKLFEVSIDNFTSAIYPPQKTKEVLSEAMLFKSLISQIISSLISSNLNDSLSSKHNLLLTTVHSLLDKAIAEISANEA